jgi:hypothetical protein
MSLFKKLFAVVIAITLWTTLVPGSVFAQGIGLGGDGFTRQLWTGTDWRAGLWKLDNNLNPVLTIPYGPFPQWEPIGIAVNQANNNSYVLWRNTNGSISLWIVDPNLNYVTSQGYGPFAGWIIKGIAWGPGGLRIYWRFYDGTLGIWTLDGNTLAATNSKPYGPFFGFVPGPLPSY